jgi:hypothetical protein
MVNPTDVLIGTGAVGAAGFLYYAYHYFFKRFKGEPADEPHSTSSGGNSTPPEDDVKPKPKPKPEPKIAARRRGGGA